MKCNNTFKRLESIAEKHSLPLDKVMHMYSERNYSLYKQAVSNNDYSIVCSSNFEATICDNLDEYFKLIEMKGGNR
jgi:hypothetical protein